MFCLFHYSLQPFDVIKCLALQGTLSKTELKKQVQQSLEMNKVIPYPYSTSFFFDPIPLDIAKYFPKDHRVWASGNKLYEYRVNVTPELAKHWLYEIVETDLSLKFLVENGYPETDEQYATFFKQRNALKRAAGEIGVGYNGLESQARIHQGKLADYFRFTERKNGIAWDTNKYKYAACVPHVMLQAQGKDIHTPVVPIPISFTKQIILR